MPLPPSREGCSGKRSRPVPVKAVPATSPMVHCSKPGRPGAPGGARHQAGGVPGLEQGKGSLSPCPQTPSPAGLLHPCASAGRPALKSGQMGGQVAGGHFKVAREAGPSFCFPGDITSLWTSPPHVPPPALALRVAPSRTSSREESGLRGSTYHMPGPGSRDTDARSYHSTPGNNDHRRDGRSSRSCEEQRENR